VTGNAPCALAYDSGKGEVFVANSASDDVSVISDSTDTVATTVAVGSYTDGIAYDQATGEILVADMSTDQVTVLNDTTDSVVATVSVGSLPGTLALDAQNGQLYVVNSDSNNVSVISAATDKVTATVAVGANPVGVVYDAGAGRAYVSNALQGTLSIITVPTIKVAPGQGPVGATVKVSGKGFSMLEALKSLVFDSKKIKTCTSGSLTASGTGTFSCTFKVPSGTSGSIVKATNVAGQVATGKFKVTTPAITVSPKKGPVGSTVTVSGTGFSVSTKLSSLVFDGVKIKACTKGSLTASGKGSFSCAFAVPSGTSGTTVTATDVGGATATGKFTVTT